MDNALIRLLGWKATVLHGDPSQFDRWRWLEKHLHSGLRTLDIGCGSGCFSLFSARVGNDTTGIDFSETNVSKAQKRAEILNSENVRFLQADLRTVDKHFSRLGQYDQVLCFETLEHIKDDRKAIRDLATLTREGGRLLLTTPYKHYRPLLGDHISDVENGDHVRWGYTHEELRQLVEEVGFVVEIEEYVSGFVSQQLTNAMRILGRANSKFAWGALLPLRLLQAVDGPVTQMIRYPYLSVGIVAKKIGPPRRSPDQ
jgi:SAM-dependent methyltransferase